MACRYRLNNSICYLNSVFNRLMFFDFACVASSTNALFLTIAVAVNQGYVFLLAL
jgi:hypothetical protein